MGDTGEGNITSLPKGRAHAAWQAWLGALADDAEAALAAALTYEALAPQDRDAWLDALDEDAPHIHAPLESIYAPLLLVEEDEARRARISRTAAMLPCVGTRGRGGACAKTGFVCAWWWFRSGFGSWRRSAAATTPRASPSPITIPLRSDDDVEHAEHRGAELERADLAFVVEDLAHAVLAAKRIGQEMPAALTAFAHLFSPEREAVSVA